MSSQSDQSAGYLGSLMLGFALFVLFGVVTYFIFLVGGLKKPTDLVMEGDFSEEQTAQRIKNLGEVRTEQAATIKPAKLEAALKSFKATAPAATAVVVPGSPTSLKLAPPAPVPAPQTPPAAKGKVPAAPKGKAKANPKGKAKADPKAKGKAKASGKG